MAKTMTEKHNESKELLKLQAHDSDYWRLKTRVRVADGRSRIEAKKELRSEIQEEKLADMQSWQALLDAQSSDILAALSLQSSAQKTEEAKVKAEIAEQRKIAATALAESRAVQAMQDKLALQAVLAEKVKDLQESEESRMDVELQAFIKSKEAGNVGTVETEEVETVGNGEALTV